jgi:hypothetical protein
VTKTRAVPAMGRPFCVDLAQLSARRRKPIVSNHLAQRHPTRAALLLLLEAVEISLSSISRRWQTVPHKLRDEMYETHRPVLLMLIEAGRRGNPGQQRG